MTTPTSTPVARTSTRRKLAYAAGGVLVLFVGIGIGSASTTPAGPSASDLAAAEQFRQMLAPNPSSSGSLPASIPVAPDPVVPAGPATAFADGTFVVGSDIEPGTYKANPAGQCYWARLSSTSSESDIIANHLAGGLTTVTISASDKAFVSTDCGSWARVR